MAPQTPAPTTNWLSWAPLALSLGGLLWIASVKVNTVDTLQREVSENSKIARDISLQISVLASRIETLGAERTRVLSEIWQARDRALAENAEDHRSFDARLRALETRTRNTHEP